MRRWALHRRFVVWWASHYVIVLVSGLSLIAIVVGSLSLLGRDGSPGSAACETARPAAPDFEAAPFDFDPEARALAFMQAMAADDFQTAYGMLALELRPEGSLCEVDLEGRWHWGFLEQDPSQSSGRVRIVVDRSASPRFSPLTDVLLVRLRVTRLGDSGRAAVDARVVVGLVRDGRVSLVSRYGVVEHMFRIPDDRRPPYADPDTFEEHEVTLGYAPWLVGGTLTMPRGTGPFPAVVLIPAGLHDRDGTVGTGRNFRDLAWGLASRGIATLRYDARTWTHALAFARQPDFTLDDELVDDGLAAVSLLRQTPRVDPARVYVLGYSLGGYATPRIAQRAPSLAGLIIVSARSGPYHASHLRAAEARYEEDGVTEVEEALRDLMRTRTARSAALAAGETVPPHSDLRVSYHRDLGAYRPEQAVRPPSTPMLLLFGDDSTELTPEDLTGWMRSLGDWRHVTFRVYAGHSHGLLDHRSFTGTPPRRQGHVGAEVIKDIAAWVEGVWFDQPCLDLASVFAGCRGGPDSMFYPAWLR